MKTQIIIKPIVTEQSMKSVASGRYSFVVAKKADKENIKQAINQLFNVTVIAVATSIIKGRRKRTGPRRIEVSDSQWKKAIVTVKKGEKIALFEPGGAEHEHKHK